MLDVCALSMDSSYQMILMSLWGVFALLSQQSVKVWVCWFLFFFFLLLLAVT